jgi:hypothetical protein
MTPETATMTPELAALVERYMAGQPQCAACGDWPGMAPMLYLHGIVETGRVRACAFALCAICLTDESLPTRLDQAIKMARPQGQAPWN